MQCPINCQERCDANTGQCLGCVAGYQGQFCDQACNPGYYGIGCKYLCSENCNITRRCNRFTGVCDGGCKAGWTGTTCTQTCSPGYYGIGCKYQCSENCNMTRRCNRFTGVCDGGCKAGWTGTTCNQECEIGYFGPDCKSECGHCLNASQCHRGNGTCLRGCSAGYIGSFCREKRQQNLSSCNDNSLVICIVVPTIIVLCGSIVNFIFWRRRRNAIDNESQSKEPSAENDKTKTIELSKQYSDLDHEREDAHPYEYI
ncbi:uncharacterized protein LOC111112782 isoform X2 [Crassostrea virginica]